MYLSNICVYALQPVWGLDAIINSQLSLPPYTDTQMLNKGESHFLTHLQNLFPSLHCACRNPTTKLGADTFIYKRDWKTPLSCVSSDHYF